jgi:putative membrane protein
VPPGRVHALEVTQPILWRPAGWWMIRINRLTGRSAADSSTDQFTTVLPVGTAADVERVLRLLQPQVPEAEWPLIVQEGILGPGAADTFVNTPRRAWWIRPLSYRRNGFRLTGDLLLLRRGLIWRRLAILPLARLQSLALQQGPLDRMSRVATLRAHVVTGPVYANLSAIARDRALGLFADASRGAVLAAGGDRSHRWAEASASDSGAQPGAATESAAQPGAATYSGGPA